jgi:peptide/nickel transport system permease protein
MATTSASTSAVVSLAEHAPVSSRSRFWAAFRRNRVAMVGLVMVALLTFAAVFAGQLAPYDPIEPHYTDVLKPPSAAFPLGTDELGRDVFSRLLYGARISLTIGFIAQGVSILIGMTMGALAGWYGGWTDDILMRITDVFFAVPGLLFLIVWVTIFDPSPVSIFLGLGLISWPGEARMMRSQVLAIRELEYVVAARALGAPIRRILLMHILPNAIQPMIVLATLGVAGVILSEATLSFLGLGIQIPNPSWGTMVQVGKNYLATGKWWYAVLPGITIMLTVLGFNFVGDGLRDALDPTLYE